MTNKLQNLLPWIQVLTLALIVVMLFSGDKSVILGGTTNFDALDTTDGYYVDATNVINGSGVWVGAITSSNDVTLSGAATLSGETRLNMPRKTGSVATLTAASTTVTLTAAQVCDSSIIAHGPTGTSATTTLPTAALMFADCLTTNGDQTSFLFQNTTTTNTISIAAGTSSTLLLSDAGDSVAVGGNSLMITLIRASATLMLAVTHLLAQ